MFYLIIILFEDVSESKHSHKIKQLSKNQFRLTLERNSQAKYHV